MGSLLGKEHDGSENHRKEDNTSNCGKAQRTVLGTLHCNGYLIDIGIAIGSIGGGASLHHIIIYMGHVAILQHAAKQIDVRALINVLALQLLGRCKVGREACGVVEARGIAETEVYEADIMTDVCDEDVVGLQVKEENLVLMEIAENGEQLRDELPRMLVVAEIIWLLMKKLCERLALYIFFDDCWSLVFALQGDISWQCRMVERKPRLKLLAEGYHITRLSSKLRLQPFEEVELAKDANKIGVAG